MTATDVEAHQRRHGFFGAPSNHAGEAEKAVISSAKGFRLAKQPNKTENAFGAILNARLAKGELVGPIRFEGVKLRIAGNCYYTPDWMVSGDGRGRPVLYEVKGAHVWDDSKIKFRAAAELHEWAYFEMWQRKAGEWRRIL